MYIVNLFLFFIFLILCSVSKIKYKNQFNKIDKTEHKLYFLYEMSMFVMDYFNIRKKFDQNFNVNKKLEQLGEDKKLYACRKIALVLFVILLSNGLSFLLGMNELKNNFLVDGKYISRPDIGQGEEEINLGVIIGQGDKTTKEEIVIQMKERQYKEKELEEVITNAKKYIDDTILGENASRDEITKPLCLVKRIPKTSIYVTWITDVDGLVDLNGGIHNANIVKEGTLVEISAVLKYNQIKIEYPIYLRILPKVISSKENQMQKLREEIVEADKASSTESKIVLPEKIEDKELRFYEKRSKTKGYLLLGGIIFAVILFFTMDYELNGKMRKRELELRIDYPEIINKFTLLLGAGMTAKNAWGRIALEYNKKFEQGQKKKRFAYEEMLTTWYELSNGITEVVAFERFGKRVKVLPYLKFSSLLSQNIKKGSKGLLDLLDYEAMEAFEERKEMAKRLGEEAGTKLLGPMMLMLLIVLFIILVPAFMSF